MKYFFPALMALVIMSGLVLVITPFIAEQFFPLATTSYQQAKTEDASQALADWLGVRPEQLSAVQAIRQRTVNASTAWFKFSVARPPVEQFIVRNRLQQKPLDAEAMQAVFMLQPPPVNWWQPASLQRETFFAGVDEGQSLALIYHAEQQLGFMRVKSVLKQSNQF